MRTEIRIFFTALMFYTRIPCPSWVDHSEEYINKATRYFPLIGWIVGGGAALTIYACSFMFPAPICVVLSLVASVLLTGAFHEDGFADVCDGFGGGWSKTQILSIMKDSRVGTYAVAGLVLLFALKIFTLVALVQLDLWFCLKALVLAHVLSRWSAATIIYTHDYSREDGTSKIKPIAKKLTASNLLIGSIWVIPCLIWFQSWWIFLVFIPIYAMKMYLARYFQKWIDGYTGDCLGATQQINEMVTLLFCLGLWKFI
ncbi:MAG: adenosylcobinamide-GDP ribazoletransferase [Bacteroidota bacterium]